MNGCLCYPIGNNTDNYNPGADATLQLGNLGANDSLGAGNYTFNGSMHDVAVYNVALSPSEIQSNFLATQILTNSAVPIPTLINSVPSRKPKSLTDSIRFPKEYDG